MCGSEKLSGRVGLRCVDGAGAENRVLFHSGSFFLQIMQHKGNGCLRSDFNKNMIFKGRKSLWAWVQKVRTKPSTKLALKNSVAISHGLHTNVIFSYRVQLTSISVAVERDEGRCECQTEVLCANEED